MTVITVFTHVLESVLPKNFPEICSFNRFIVQFIKAIPSRTPIHFLQESVRFHFQDHEGQCIILAGILEDHARKCLVLQDLARNE